MSVHVDIVSRIVPQGSRAVWRLTRYPTGNITVDVRIGTPEAIAIVTRVEAGWHQCGCDFGVSFAGGDEYALIAPPAVAPSLDQH